MSTSSIILIAYQYFLLLLIHCFQCNDDNNQKHFCNSESGWECDYSAPFSHRNGDHSFCDLDIISLDSSLDEFIDKYYFKKPVIINTSISDWTNNTFWYKNNLLNEFGLYEFGVGKSLNIVLRAGVSDKKMTLSSYINSNNKNKNNYKYLEPLYIFDRTIWDTENNNFFTNHINTKNIKFFNYASSKINYNGQIMAIGNSGTGATIHAHGENWLFLISGRKRWFLYPPNLTPVGGFWPGFSSRDWFDFIYPYLDHKYDYKTNFESNPINYNFSYEFSSNFIKPRSSIFNRFNNSIMNRLDILNTDYNDLSNNLIKPIECIQSEGQLIYLPEFWWHSVINLGDVIGAAIQTSTAITPWMLERDIHDYVRRGINNDNLYEWTDLEAMSERYSGINAYKRLKKYGPISAVHEFFIGFEYYDMGLNYFDKAIKYLTNTILMDSTYIEAYSYLSRIYSNNDPENIFYDINMAEKILRIAYLLNPNNESVQFELLNVFRQQNKRELFEIVSKHKPLPK